MSYYISGDSILENISTAQFFHIDYFNKYLTKVKVNNNIINSIENKRYHPLVFITKIDYLDDFYNKILKTLNTTFILITHYGDGEAGLHDKILNHPLLIKWYGQNMSIRSNKTESIPIGLENTYWNRTNINKIKECSNNSKDKLLYLNFSLYTNPNRSKIMNSLLKNGFNKNKQLDWDSYIEDLSRHKFCISPNGNGVDCHRTWECLYLGVIPIVEKSIHMSYFHDLPILFVDNYNDISTEYLNQIYKDFKHKSFNIDKLSLSYWTTKIHNHFKSPIS